MENPKIKHAGLLTGLILMFASMQARAQLSACTGTGSLQTFAFLPFQGHRPNIRA